MYDFYTNGAVRNHDSFQSVLVTMLRDLKAQSDGNASRRVVYVSVLADSWASRQVIEKLGFGWVGSLVQVSAFGCSRYTQIRKAEK